MSFLGSAYKRIEGPVLTTALLIGAQASALLPAKTVPAPPSAASAVPPANVAPVPPPAAVIHTTAVPPSANLTPAVLTPPPAIPPAAVPSLPLTSPSPFAAASVAYHSGFPELLRSIGQGVATGTLKTNGDVSRFLAEKTAAFNAAWASEFTASTALLGKIRDPAGLAAAFEQAAHAIDGK